MESFLLPPLTVILSEAKDLWLILKLLLLLRLLLVFHLHLLLLLHVYFYSTRRATADPSTPLRFAQDDSLSCQSGILQMLDFGQQQ